MTVTPGLPAPQGDDDARWDAALTALEDELDRQEEWVRLGEATSVPTWEPPADLGPIPVRFYDRARTLMGRIDLLSTFVQYQLTALDSDIQHLHRQGDQHKRGANNAIALYLDASV